MPRIIAGAEAGTSCKRTRSQVTIRERAPDALDVTPSA
jgi:hypothetical protein